MDLLLPTLLIGFAAGGITMLWIEWAIDHRPSSRRARRTQPPTTGPEGTAGDSGAARH